MKRTWCAIQRFWALALLVAAAGCGLNDIDTTYGRRGTFGGASVNGTAVLADMFTAAGHTVETRSSLSPRLHAIDTIVWFPDSYKVPSQHVVYWLEDWLASAPDRTLIIVGRDYDAAPEYWRQVLPGAKAEQAEIIQQRLDRALDRRDDSRDTLIDGDECSWYTVKELPKTVQASKLAGPWSQGIDASKTHLEFSSLLQPPSWAQSLLTSDENVLVSKQTLDDWPRGNQLILIANGSFLLNLPLVNHEHRKLAGKLIESVKPQGQVVFLESGPRDVRIDDKDPAPRMPNGLEVLAIWPMNAILLHLAVLGIIFCFARWPIFGTPLEPVTGAPSDFSQHVDALGDLLARSGNRDYAQRKVQAWRDSGPAGQTDKPK